MCYMEADNIFCRTHSRQFLKLSSFFVTVLTDWRIDLQAQYSKNVFGPFADDPVQKMQTGFEECFSEMEGMFHRLHKQPH